MDTLGSRSGKLCEISETPSEKNEHAIFNGSFTTIPFTHTHSRKKVLQQFHLELRDIT